MSIAKKTVRTIWDYETYAAIPSDGKRHEIIEGDHFVNPAPNLYHQEITRRIQFQLYTQIELAELGKVIDAPVDLQLAKNNIVQPDLVIVLRERKHILTPTKIKGVPNLVVEILSPSNQSHDLNTKRNLYQQSGVPEYWIVNPEEHQVLQLVLDRGAYSEKIETDSLSMAMPPHSKVDLLKVW